MEIPVCFGRSMCGEGLLITGLFPMIKTGVAYALHILEWLPERMKSKQGRWPTLLSCCEDDKML